MTRVALGLVLGLLAVLISAPGSAQAPAADAFLDGFRSAKFGMTEEQVRAAIVKDFKVDAKIIQADINPIEKTRVLAVNVPNLSDTGMAKLGYVFGFKSKTLIQVNVLWGRGVDPKTTPEQLVSTANVLRNYFVGQPFKEDGRMVNQAVQGGSVVAFRGFDAKDRMALLILNVPGGVPEGADPKAKEAAQAEALKNMALQLSYVMDSKKPDIFQVEKGQF